MRALLLPVKDLTNAKKRLIGVLTPGERFGLAQAMLADTIHAVRSVRRADKIFVVTNYLPAKRHPRNRFRRFCVLLAKSPSGFPRMPLPGFAKHEESALCFAFHWIFR